MHIKGKQSFGTCEFHYLQVNEGNLYLSYSICLCTFYFWYFGACAVLCVLAIRLYPFWSIKYSTIGSFDYFYFWILCLSTNECYLTCFILLGRTYYIFYASMIRIHLVTCKMKLCASDNWYSWSYKSWYCKTLFVLTAGFQLRCLIHCTAIFIVCLDIYGIQHPH